ncbi:Trypsin-like peptidase domain-containing protein [Enhydrobacter aerosaccus]|uniref:Trypsin-like peptidase domain-containing protein n=1 Tax=Enhydrobacter aerosaccus TaxID=225324 RepID=A0A1T4RBD3_9HYPH|nr:serine protease [Enhydrobacter aerosaccus]SKA13360.1 Trypsin-like peptidase domain-containing protein [Enhydrobacter aerosaccus]
MSDTPPTDRSTDRPRWRWPLILGGLVGGALLVGAGLGLGWYLFYRPVVNVAVQLPAPPPPPAPPGPDEKQVKALEDQIDKQKAANKQIEDQIAVLKERLKADVCTIKDPLGKTTPNATPAPEGALPGRKSEAAPAADLIPAAAKTGKTSSGDLATALERSTVLIVSPNGDSGSGFFVSSNVVVTNHHVVGDVPVGSEVLLVSKALKTPYIGQVLATSPKERGDFALIRADVPAGTALPLPLAAEPTALGDVVAAGYPAIGIAMDRDLHRLADGDLKAAPQVVLTKGTVSAVQNRDRGPIVLHSADISPGNSGGPLVDTCGRVVGINTFLVSDQQTSKANYALGASWLAAYLRSSKAAFDWRSDSCT